MAEMEKFHANFWRFLFRGQGWMQVVDGVVVMWKTVRDYGAGFRGAGLDRKFGRDGFGLFMRGVLPLAAWVRMRLRGVIWSFASTL